MPLTLDELRKSLVTNKINPTAEQEKIVGALKNNNVIVSAVAGSGKTTTSIFIAKKYFSEKILLITYSKKLQEDSKIKIKNEEVKNIDVYTIHGLASKIAKKSCSTDSALEKVLENLDQYNLDWFNDYHMIILDEVQDFTLLYYQFIYQFMYLVKPLKICALGDENQNIYQFKKANSRFLTFADELWSNINSAPWVKLPLSMSFRITDTMRDFTNEVFFKKHILSSNKPTKNQVNYIYENSFYGDIIKTEIQECIKEYGIENVVLLSPSVKSEKTPLKKILNFLSNKGILIYSAKNGKEDTKESEMKNKLCALTFHQAKGIERKVVFVFSFDNGYFTYYDKDSPTDRFTNALYVAITRAKEKLYLIHNKPDNDCYRSQSNGKNGFLPFINKKKILKYAKLLVNNENDRKAFNDLVKQHPAKIDKFESPIIGVTKLIEYLDYKIISDFKLYCDIKKDKIDSKVSFSKIPSEINLEKKGKKYTENISNINGTSISIKLDIEKNKMIINDLLSKIKYNPDWIKNERRMILKYEPYLLKLKDAKTIKNIDILFLSDIWTYFMDGFNQNLNQIPYKNHDWINDADIEKIYKLVDQMIGKDSEFERLVELESKPELMKKKLMGYIDAINIKTKTIWEFKFVTEIKDEHYLQLLIYAYLFKNTNSDFKKYTYSLLNIRKNEIYHLENIKWNKLDNYVKQIFKAKYQKNAESSNIKFIKTSLDSVKDDKNKH